MKKAIILIGGLVVGALVLKGAFNSKNESKSLKQVAIESQNFNTDPQSSKALRQSGISSAALNGFNAADRTPLPLDQQGSEKTMTSLANKENKKPITPGLTEAGLVEQAIFANLRNPSFDAFGDGSTFNFA